jgi:UDP-galactopyranose mutase
MNYDYLIVGSGLFGAVCAFELKKKGKKVLVLERRSHIGGNVYTKDVEGIQVHKYGAHIFHTNDKEIWDYVNGFVEFNRFTNSPLANYKGQLFNLPFNMNTFYQLWGTKTPNEAKDKIDEQKKELVGIEPGNLEEQAISLVGRDIYEKLIKGYTEKQWGRKCVQLPAFIIRRLPVRFTYDNNYFSDKYQGIPIGGYTKLIEKMLQGVEVRLNVDFLKNKTEYSKLASKIIYTGQIDEYFDNSLGRLEYRSLKFETETLSQENYQGNAVVNYTDSDTPYTRIIEHKHFDSVCCAKTVITKEYPCEWENGDEPY